MWAHKICAAAVPAPAWRSEVALVAPVLPAAMSAALLLLGLQGVRPHSKDTRFQQQSLLV